MNFIISEEITADIAHLNNVIVETIKPMKNHGCTIRIFNHCRENIRTDWERDDLPKEEWETPLGKRQPAAYKSRHSGLR